jgi:Mechanosensitive ion channel, conserved TM helix
MWTTIINAPLEEMVTKFLLVIPNIAAAIAVLVIGYIIARIMKAVVVKFLTSTKLFGKVEEWKIPEKERPVELIGALTFYLVMLFVLLAFFNVLNLPIIADPINKLVSTVMEYLPRVVGAGIILLIAWIIAKVLRLVILKGLEFLKFDEKTSKYFNVKEGRKPSQIIAGITFYLVLLFALPAFLEALKLSSVTNPLSEMWSKFTGILPNLLAATIIGVIGFLVAKIVREIIVNLLVGFGMDRGAERIGIDKNLGELKASGMVGTIVYVLILIPVFVAAFDALNIAAISGPGREMLAFILNKLPAIFAAVVIIILAVVIGKILQNLLAQVLSGVGFNKLLEDLGVKRVGNKTPSQVVGILAFIYIIFFAIMEAAEVLNFKMLSDLSSRFITFAFKMILALIIFGVGILIGNWVKRLVQGAAQDRPFLANLAKMTVIVFALAIALQNLGIADEIVILAFGLLLGSIAVAAAIAFGIGSKEIAGREVDAWVKKLKGEK